MSNELIQMPGVSITREHQAAPAKHYADVALEIAAEEIASGKYIPPKRDFDELNIALRSGLGEETYDPKTVTPADFESTAFSLDLAYHPRVAEALDRMAREVEVKKDHGQEYIEKAQMLHEMNVNAQKKNRWPGQERWKDPEAEEKRMGQLLTPFQFLEKLCEVIGPTRVMLNRFVVLPTPASLSGRVALLVKSPDRKKSPLTVKMDSRTMQLTIHLRRLEKDFRQVRDIDKSAELKRQINMTGLMLEERDRRANADEFEDFLQVGTLQSPNNTEWMVMAFDEFGVPTIAKYIGWRTALLSMIRLDVITEKEAHKAFPLKGGTDASEWYMQQLFEWRNGRRG